MSMPMRTTTSSAGMRAAIRTPSSPPRSICRLNPDVKAGGRQSAHPLCARPDGGKGARLRSRSTRRSIWRTTRTSRPHMSTRSRTSCGVGAGEGRQPAGDHELCAATASTTSTTCSTIRTSRPPKSIRCCTSRRSAGTKAAIRTPCSIRPAIWRTTPTWRPPASIRSITITTVGWREGRDPSLEFDTASYLAANPDVAAAQYRSAHALSSDRHPRRPPGNR